jgi:hypothetical protein
MRSIHERLQGCGDEAHEDFSGPSASSGTTKIINIIWDIQPGISNNLDEVISSSDYLPTSTLIEYNENNRLRAISVLNSGFLFSTSIQSFRMATNVALETTMACFNHSRFAL